MRAQTQNRGVEALNAHIASTDNGLLHWAWITHAFVVERVPIYTDVHVESDGDDVKMVINVFALSRVVGKKLTQIEARR